MAGCGGGSGAPNNPYTPPPPVIPPLTLLPDALTVFAGSPVTLTVYGGVPPYRAFSSNSTALPVASAVSGETIVLLANNVTATTGVAITVQDSVGTVSLPAGISVQPAPLLPSSITVNANPNPACDTVEGNLCSGSTGTAQVTVTGPGGAGLKGRAVRFDVVQGAFSIVSTNPAQPLVNTLTVVTDANGNAVVVLSVPADTPTQTGIIRATDVTTGNQVTGSFPILQMTVGGAVLSVLPLGTTTITGPDNQHCSSGVTVTNYIFGGTPPYQVAVNFPQYVTLGGVPVLKSGGAFTTTTNGGCFINLTYVITDATGRTIPGNAYPTVTNQLGTNAPAPPPPTELVATPGAISKVNCVPANTFQFLLTGGTAPYSVVTASTTSSTSVVLVPQTGITSGQAVTVSGITSPASTTITAYDSSSPRFSTTVTIDCSGAPPPTPPSALVIAPQNYNYTAASNPNGCVNQTSNFVVTGGTPPYSVFFASPRPGASISPTTLAASGQGFSVTGLTNGVQTTNITVADSGTPQLQGVATITCPITTPTGPLTVTPGNIVIPPPPATPGTCVGGTFNYVITGGTPPYTVAFPTPPNAGATIAPTLVGFSGGGFQVTGLRDTTSSPNPGQTLTNVTVTDSAPVPAVVIRSITCP
ncbi:MAG: hypothetical protein U1F58_10275 [Burkholderiales bacterium]